ncbi:PQQ-binding-like beta-propeller repeat protein [bacterium]|nr:PQQ-binding-like beta-propeller repeat protein [bacterium]
MKARHFSLIILTFVVAFSACGGGSSSPQTNQSEEGGTGGGSGQDQGSASPLVAFPATSTPNPGSIVFLEASANQVDNIVFEWSSDCLNGSFYPDKFGQVITEGADTKSIVWFQTPNTTDRTCQIRVDGESPTSSYSGTLPSGVTTRSLISTDWVSFQGSPNNTGRTSQTELGPTPAQLGQVWKVPGGNVSSVSPALSVQGAGGRVVLGDLSGLVRTFDAVNGTPLWTTPLQDRMVGNPIIGDATVLVAASNGAIKALDLFTGNEVWTSNIGNRIEGTPAYAFGLLSVGTLEGQVFTLTTGTFATSGAERVLWNAQPEEGGRFVAPLTIFDGIEASNPSLSDLSNATVFGGSDKGFFYGWDLSTGEEVFKQFLGSAISSAPAVFQVGSDPAVAVGTEDGNVWLFKATPPYGPLGTTNPIFTSNSPVRTAPLFHNGELYFFLRDSRIFSIDPFTGDLISSTFIPEASPDAENLQCAPTPAAAQSPTDVPYLYLSCHELILNPDPLAPFATARGLLLILSKNLITGNVEELARYPIGTFQFDGGGNTPSDPIVSSPGIMAGKVFFTASDGSLYALGTPPDTGAFGATPSTWVSKRGDSAGTGYCCSVDSGTPGIGTLQEKWTYQMSGPITGSPSLANGVLWVGDLNGNLVGIRAADGMFRFQWTGFNEIGATPLLLEDGLVWTTGLSGMGSILQVDGDRITELGKVRTAFLDRLTQGQGRDSLNQGTQVMRFVTSLSGAYDPQLRALFTPMVNDCQFSSNAFSECDGSHWENSQNDQMNRTDDLMIAIFNLNNPNNISMIQLNPSFSLENGEMFSTSLGLHHFNGASYLVAGFTDQNGAGHVEGWDVTDPFNPTSLWGGATLNLGGGFVPSGVPTFIDNFVVIGTRDDNNIAPGTVFVYDLTDPGPPLAVSQSVDAGGIGNAISVSFNPSSNQGFLFIPITTGRLIAQPYRIQGGVFSFSGTTAVPWIQSANDFIRSAPGIDLESGVVYIGSDDGNLYRYERDSGFDLAGTFQANGPIIASPIIVGGYLVVADYTGLITVLGPGT